MLFVKIKNHLFVFLIECIKLSIKIIKKTTSLMEAEITITYNYYKFLMKVNLYILFLYVDSKYFKVFFNTKHGQKLKEYDLDD